MLNIDTIKLCIKLNIDPNSLELILDGIDYAKPSKPDAKHISIQSLCLAIRDMTLKRYGPLAQAVLNHYGVKSTEDIGLLVFKLIKHGLLTQSGDDHIEDFNNVFDFDKAFNTAKYVKALPI